MAGGARYCFIRFLERLVYLFEVCDKIDAIVIRTTQSVQYVKPAFCLRGRFNGGTAKSLFRAPLFRRTSMVELVTVLNISFSSLVLGGKYSV